MGAARIIGAIGGPVLCVAMSAGCASTPPTAQSNGRSAQAVDIPSSKGESTEGVHRFQFFELDVDIHTSGGVWVRIGDGAPIVVDVAAPRIVSGAAILDSVDAGSKPAVQAVTDMLAVVGALNEAGTVLADEVAREMNEGGRGKAAEIAEAWLTSGIVQFDGTMSDGRRTWVRVKLTPELRPV